MRLQCLIIYLIVIMGSQAFFITPNVHSQEINYEVSGVMYEQPSFFNIKDDNLINPDNEIIQFSDWTNRFYGRLNVNLYYENVKFISQTRPTFFMEENNEDFDWFTDDVYFDMGIGEKYFFYIGKRNLRDVVAYGENPTDFMGEDKEVDFTKREEERRVEREGNYLIGGEAFLSNLTLSANYAPEIDDLQDDDSRFLMRGNLFAESLNSDMSLHYFHGEIPGVGFDISSTVSDNLVLHVESAFRWGSRNKELKVLSQGDDFSPREFEISDTDDDEDVFPHVVLGGSYTLGDGTNIILEYIYNGDGYSEDEWDEIVEFIKYNEDAYRNDFFKDLATSNLAEANNIVQVREMRKHYVFFRISNSSLINNLDGQLVFIVNTADKSFLTFPSVDYKVGDNFVAGLSATLYSGDDDEEFGMMFWGSEVSLVLKYYFSL